MEKKKTLLCLEICCSLLFFCRCLHFKKSTSFHNENKKSQYEMNIKVPTPSNMSLISRPNLKCKIYLFTIKRKCSQIITFTPFLKYYGTFFWLLNIRKAIKYLLKVTHNHKLFMVLCRTPLCINDTELNPYKCEYLQSYSGT